jgi:2-haloacid dehalogenase
VTSTQRVHTLVFDILGTLLDEDAGMAGVAEQVVSADEVPAFLAEWNRLHQQAFSDVREGRRPYVTSEALHAEAIAAAARAHGRPVTDERAAGLATFGRALSPFSEVAEAFEALARDHRVVGLTNAGLTQAFEMSGFAGLRWTTLISSELVGAFKPDPRMYEFARTRLSLDTESCLFVAAHPWDLDAAAEHGFRTAYVDRSSSSPSEMDDFRARFDHAEPDVAALAVALTS